ncbi:DUF6538 domain-containing protein [Xanthobacter sp. V0B-10]|uniref:DUF6538 domain-containing protein n=1 Tax=Xanthobacter albus TaxID=3119929 RepID=UPI0037295E49
MRHDTRFLELHGNQYRVKVKVPADARPVLGKAHLKVPLHTDSLVKANMLKWPVVARLKAEIDAARRTAEAKAAGGNPVVVEAMEWREALAQGDEIAADILLPERAEEIEQKHGAEAAKAFVNVAKGKATPIATLLAPWLAEAQYAGRTEAAYRQAVAKFLEWAEKSSISPIVEAVDRRAAGRYIQEVFVTPGADPATANKLVSGLSALWAWAIKRGHGAEANPWIGQGLRAKKVKAPDGGGATRPFTDKEVSAILVGANGTLGDMCRVAALTGMRLSEIAGIKVADVHLEGAGSPFLQVVEGKTDAASRAVPLHPDLRPLVSLRCKGKKENAFLFHELPEQRSQQRSRGTAMSQTFTRLLRELKLEDKLPGHRQARTGFHSWRRWFIRKAVEALEQGATGFTAWTLADVVGHSKEAGPLPMTMGRYPGAAGMEAKRACVLAVQLPKAEAKE